MRATTDSKDRSFFTRETDIYIYIYPYIYIYLVPRQIHRCFLAFPSLPPLPPFCTSELLIRKRPHNSYPAADLPDVTIDIIPDIWRKVILYGEPDPVSFILIRISRRATLFTSLNEFSRIDDKKKKVSVYLENDCENFRSLPFQLCVNQSEKLTMENR